MPEGWGAILATTAAVLLGATATAGAMQPLRPARHVETLLPAGRAAVVIVLAVATALAAMVDGSPSLLDVRLVTVGTVLAATAVHLALTLAFRQRTGVWPVDALLAGLLTAVLFLTPGAIAVDCTQRALAFFVEWALYLFGGGAVLVAGGAGLAALYATHRQPEADAREAQQILVAALLLSLVSLGGGLLVGAWWSWQTTGRLMGSDLRQVWMAVAWVVAGMALAAGEMKERTHRWVAAFALIAAAVTIFGLLIVPDLIQMWGG